MNKKILIIAIVVLLAVAGAYLAYQNLGGNKPNGQDKNDADKLNQIKTFEECVAGGYPVQESYPRVCKLPNGSSFTESVPNDSPEAKSNLITVDEPKQNAVITSPLAVSGKARGNWFFEASFPIRIVDGNGQELGIGLAQAQGDWMTAEFVPFTAEIEFVKPETDTGTIVFERDNPSGLPENADQMVIPVRFK